MTNFFISTSRTCVCVCEMQTTHLAVFCSGFRLNKFYGRSARQRNKHSGGSYYLWIGPFYSHIALRRLSGLLLFVVYEPRLLAKLLGRLAASFRPRSQMFLIHKWQQFMSTKCRARRLLLNTVPGQLRFLTHFPTSVWDHLPQSIEFGKSLSSPAEWKKAPNSGT